MNHRLVLVIVLCLLPILACNQSGGFNVRVDDDYSYLTVTLNEEDIRGWLVPALENGRELRMQDPVLDLRPGEIHVSGSVIGRDGRLYPGNLTIRAWAENNRLQLAIVTFSFSGYNADQGSIARWNSDIAAGLERAAASDRNQSETTDVTITDSSLSITWRTPRQS
jgi:hypothetical protein